MNHLYCRLASINLKNNRQFYLPYLLAGIISVVMFYIMCAIRGSESLNAMRGHSLLKTVLTMGFFIVGACAFIFLFYTNSFVIKKRKKELGVYNILGMEKKHIAKVMAWEAAILYIYTTGGGLIFGIMFHKLVTMFLYKLTGLSESIPFYISLPGCLKTILFFAVLYLLMLLYNFIQIKLANPIELLHGGSMGEREPKAKWAAAVFGILCILAGYYLALNVYGVLEAVNHFFIAVIFVIIGTYALFMTISIAFLKLLKGNKKYYYKTTHFITVSGMLYRMKRNAIGLANICILSTMVLVMISTTACMYAGTEDSLRHLYRKEVSADIYFNAIPDDYTQKFLSEQMIDLAKKQNRTITELSEYINLVLRTHITGNEIERYDNDNPAYDYKDISMLYAMTKNDYEKTYGKTVADIPPDSIITASSCEFTEDTLLIFGDAYPIAAKTDLPDDEMTDFLGNMNIVYVITEDYGVLERIQKACTRSGDNPVQIRYHIDLEIDGTRAEKIAYTSAASDILTGYGEQMGYDAILVESRAEQWEEYMEMNGGFLFLGLFLGIMFLLITVMIIYYKQISEGFEDRDRFAIMIKVGMNRDMVKSAINTQVRTVFFMPIIVAVIHLIAAFPMLKLILLVFGLTNTPLFAGCLAGTAAIFAAIYFIVFKLTSRSYYKIVYR